MYESLGGSHTNATLLAVARSAKCAQCTSHLADESGKISHEKLQVICPSLLEASGRGLDWQVISHEAVVEDRSGVSDAPSWFVCLFLPRLTINGSSRGKRRSEKDPIWMHLSERSHGCRSGFKPQAIASTRRTACPSARLGDFLP